MARARRPRVVNGRLIKPREPGRLAELARLLTFGALLAIPAFLYANLQAQLHHYRRTIVGLEQRMDDLDGQRRRLELEIATLRDPRRIEQLARNEGGLVPVDQDQIVYLTRPTEPLTTRPGYVADAPGDVRGRQRP